MVNRTDDYGNMVIHRWYCTKHFPPVTGFKRGKKIWLI